MTGAMRPLDSLLVLDASRVLACPFASMILAEPGAALAPQELIDWRRPRCANSGRDEGARRPGVLSVGDDSLVSSRRGVDLGSFGGV